MPYYYSSNDPTMHKIIRRSKNRNRLHSADDSNTNNNKPRRRQKASIHSLVLEKFRSSNSLPLMMEEQEEDSPRRLVTPRSLGGDSWNDDDDDDDEVASTATTVASSSEQQMTLMMSSNVTKNSACLYDADEDDDESNSTHHHRLTPNKPRYALPSRSEKLALYPEPSLTDALRVWTTAAHDVWISQETQELVQCSFAVAYCAGHVVVRTVTWPIRWPVSICCSTVGVVVDTSVAIVRRTLTSLQQQQSQHQASGQDSDEEEHHQGLVKTVISLPFTVISIAGKIVVEMVAPVLGNGGGDGNSDDDAEQLQSERKRKTAAQQQHQQQQSGVSSSPERKRMAVIPPTPAASSSSSAYPDYLDKLRLDYTPKKGGGVSLHAVVGPLTAEPLELADTSKYLLRVNDLDLDGSSSSGSSSSRRRIFFIDLDPDHAVKLLIAQALDRMVHTSLSLLANHPHCSIDGSSYETTAATEIQWQPEGATKRLLRKGTFDPLRQSLVWSGNFQHDDDDAVAGGYGRKFSFFLARGSIAMAPRQFMELLWDNDRTTQYNNFCLGRSTIHAVSGEGDAVLQGAETGTKVIKSEMRVPFTSLTVKAVCLMHVRPIPDGYVIVSRSLDCGTAGTHFGERYDDLTGIETEGAKTSRNEILWGCNVIRRSRNGVTDLTSLSQVGSAVPKFLASKIGLMGIEDFFKNVRKVANATAKQ